MRTIDIRVTGRVQGVSYRAFARDTALQLGVTGYVRNAADGSVAARATADEPTLAKFVEALRRGPILAGVDDVSIDDVPLTDEDDGFVIQR